MNSNDVTPGIKVVVNKLETTEGMSIAQEILKMRTLTAQGIVKGHVPGHGGDVWFVEHGPGCVAAYCFTEIEPVT